MPETLGIIPARGGSRRIPGKNERLLAGHPLVDYALKAALESTLLDRIVLSSDVDTILDRAQLSGRIFPIKRPEQLARDHSPAIEYVQHVLQEMKWESPGMPERIVIIQPSSPFTRGSDIDATIRIMDQTACRCAVSVREVAHDLHPSKYKVLSNHMLYPYFEEEKGRRTYDELQKVYVRNGSVYVMSRDLVEEGKLLEDPCAAYVMPAERSLDINEELDFLFAEFLMQNSGR